MHVMYFITAPGGKPASESTVAVSNRAVLIVSRIYAIKCQFFCLYVQKTRITVNLKTLF